MDFYKSTERTVPGSARRPILRTAAESYISGSPGLSITMKYDSRCSERVDRGEGKEEEGGEGSPYLLIVSASKTRVARAIFHLVRSSRSISGEGCVYSTSDGQSGIFFLFFFFFVFIRSSSERT